MNKIFAAAIEVEAICRAEGFPMPESQYRLEGTRSVNVVSLDHFDR